ncbi:unnamed protein product [Effrenium voratum]|nr:unnamed protein product [Effrenium voratum]|mmetsp:Transcript_52212/g.124964  ORF Transcript_52212/g.124964 Transcript_52212/m.124964 type:complete len:157 (-) Transcript_52212:43-513(-)
MGGLPESMCYTSVEKKEPVLGWFGEHAKLEKETHELRAEGADERKEDSPELTAARQRRQRVLAALKKPSTDQLRRRFTQFDVNSDGKLDRSEVKLLLRQGQPSMTDHEMEVLFKKLDRNSDARVSFNELVSWVFSSEGPSAEEGASLFIPRRGSVP